MCDMHEQLINDVAQLVREAESELKRPVAVRDIAGYANWKHSEVYERLGNGKQSRQAQLRNVLTQATVRGALHCVEVARCKHWTCERPQITSGHEARVALAAGDENARIAVTVPMPVDLYRRLQGLPWGGSSKVAKVRACVTLCAELHNSDFYGLEQLAASRGESVAQTLAAIVRLAIK